MAKYKIQPHLKWVQLYDIFLFL